MMTTEKIKIIDNKIEQNKAQYNLGRHTDMTRTYSHFWCIIWKC